MIILQINTSVNTGSTGRITEQIGRKAIQNGHISSIAYGVSGSEDSRSKLIKVGSRPEMMLHGLKTRMFDLHGFGSKNATLALIDKIKIIKPDVIGLHNLHGYYLNIEVLFNFLKESQKSVVWTFHDCWPFTGHCTYFDSVGCKKWINGCYDCPKTRFYPASYGLDNSKWNYEKKKELFNGLENLRIVTPSQWLAGLVKKSFLKKYPVDVIHNGVDIDIFTPQAKELPSGFEQDERKIVLGVASVWDKRKGLEDFKKLRQILDKSFRIVLVGLNNEQLSDLPSGITGIARTENVHQLAALYGLAEVFVNPTWQDNFPTTNIESLACGTPVITYDTGGSPESINRQTGKKVDQGDITGIKNAIVEIAEKGKSFYKDKCREQAISHYDKNDRFQDYVNLYEELVTIQIK
ncbi:glycosyltransferase [Rhodohalobacter barkolensis]|uniref:Glycosyl transferase n=1 Tax=Rhodohalobacter barkolensis TaxID=2053187 RepID=A0A2N0VGF7_9BACT|nr:glycosyltransferase [Rhodohalobacter barkolensis]PKD43250.1 glycosyl transferase [Rhodohalobacter barkolensis]